jgi:methionyl-tRNA formyltransferase
MSLVFFGSPRFAVPSLKSLIEAGEKVEAVVTQTDKPVGRSRRPQAPPVKEFALERGLRVLQPPSMRDEAFLRELEAIRPEFIVVVAYGRILTKRVLAAPSKAPVNLHASLLPRYRGASPIAWAVINGEKETGLTTMLITEGLDEGDILLQERHGIRPDDTADSLALRLSEAGGPLLVKTLSGLRDGSIEPVPQGGGATYAPLLQKEDGRVDWSKRARELYNFVRGMHPWPGAFTHAGGIRIRLLRTRAVPGKGEPGRVMRISDESFEVGTGDGRLEVLELQPEGGRAMSARDFLHGRRLLEGACLG